MFNLIISLQCLNKDGVKIVLDVTYQYKVKASKLREVILDFRDKDGYTKVLKYAGMSLWDEVKRWGPNISTILNQ